MCIQLNNRDGSMNFIVNSVETICFDNIDLSASGGKIFPLRISYRREEAGTDKLEKHLALSIYELSWPARLELR